MKIEVQVNKFQVDFWDDGHPRWVTIRYEGNELVRVHHKEAQDLEYALSRIRSELRRVTPDERDVI